MPLDQTANIGTEKHGNNQLRRVRKHHKPCIPLNLNLRLALCCIATHAKTIAMPLPQKHGWAGFRDRKEQHVDVHLRRLHPQTL